MEKKMQKSRLNLKKYDDMIWYNIGRLSCNCVDDKSKFDTLKFISDRIQNYDKCVNERGGYSGKYSICSCARNLVKDLNINPSTHVAVDDQINKLYTEIADLKNKKRILDELVYDINRSLGRKESEIINYQSGINRYKHLLTATRNVFDDIIDIIPIDKKFECCICKSFLPKIYRAILPCMHNDFCFFCINKLVQTNCPLCRHVFEGRDVITYETAYQSSSVFSSSSSDSPSSDSPSSESDASRSLSCALISNN